MGMENNLVKGYFGGREKNFVKGYFGKNQCILSAYIKTL